MDLKMQDDTFWWEGRQINQGQIRVGRSFVLTKIFQKQNIKMYIEYAIKVYVQIKKKILNIFGNKNVNVIVNDLDGLATT